MTRQERNEFYFWRRIIKSVERDNSKLASFAISLGFSADLKKAIVDMLIAIGYYPYGVGIPSWGSGKENKIICIYYGDDITWHDCHTQSERESICKAINE